MTASHLEMDEKELLIRIDERVENLGKILTALVTSIDERGRDIEELKTAKLLHEQETKQQVTDLNSFKLDVENFKKETDRKFITVNNDVSILKSTSILLWSQKHQKLTWFIVIIFLIMLNFHDIIVPWLFSLFGFKVP